ncbi:MAG: ABC transporter ATP-binding protein [Lachnospiraceae bacterium]
MIVLENLCKTYEIGGEIVKALDHASLHIDDGEFVSIIGPSGSGKSTLMNMIGCLDVADEGNYYLDGMAIEEYSEDDLARVRNEKIGFVFQNFNLLSRLSAQENIELPLIYQQIPKKEREERVRLALKKVQLEDRKEHKPMELSGGQQQRVAIARALVTEPSMILADEPTGNLDSKTGEEIMSLFHELHAQGNTIVLITHDESVANQADRKIRIKDGRVQEVNMDDRISTQQDENSQQYLIDTLGKESR